MNAPQRVTDDYSSMLGQAEQWRGECIQHFAELEQIVEDLLRALHRAPGHKSKVGTRKLVGEAFGHLRELTGSKGPFAEKGRPISETLALIAPWFEWRAHLTHGVVTIWRGRNGHWLLAYEHRPAGGDTIRTFALPWTQAREMRTLLQENIFKLQDNARSLGNAVLKA
jgi:hypothetical protein